MLYFNIFSCSNTIFATENQTRNIYEDPYIASTIIRFVKGTAQACDFVWVQHEVHELHLIRQGYSVSDAHAQTQLIYDYASALNQGTNVLNEILNKETF